MDHTAAECRRMRAQERRRKRIRDHGRSTIRDGSPLSQKGEGLERQDSIMEINECGSGESERISPTSPREIHQLTANRKQYMRAFEENRRRLLDVIMKESRLR